VIRLLAIALALAACRSPDAVRSGVSYRDEEFRGAGVVADEYTGPSAWVEVEWQLRPQRVLLDYDPAARLFLTELEHAHQPAQAPGNVEVKVEGAEPAKSIVSDLTALAGEGKDADGNWTPWGAVVAIAIVLVWRETRRPKVAA